MRKRKAKTEDTFAASLKAATERLAEAKEERTAAQLSLATLDREIPVLERTIQALQIQITPIDTAVNPVELSIATGIPREHLESGAPVNEDEFLPDPEGDPVLPE